MRIVLNGEEKTFPGPLTLQGLLDSLQVQPARVACEVNLKIIRRAQYTAVNLQEGDAVEIIQAIGGG